jgi:hypothetical protein
MQARVDPNEMSHADAAARLRYLGEVRQRARRASLAPSFALLILGAIAVVHGLLATLWPHASALGVIWIAALIAIRPLLRVLLRRQERRRGVQARPRLRLASAAAAVAFVAIAIASGADAMVAAIAAAGAFAAYLARMPAVAVAALAVGIIGDVLIHDGLAPATGQMIVGAGLLAAGVMSLAREREGV